MNPKWSLRDKEWIEGLKKQLLSDDKMEAEMNLSKFACPICESVLSISEEFGAIDLICLNMCHLPADTRMKFQKELEAVSNKIG